MNRYLTLFLVFSAFILFACDTYKLIKDNNIYKKELSAPIKIEEGSNVVYKANVDLSVEKLSGLFVIFNADSLFKVSFISEMGIKFFDMTIDEEGYEFIYCMEPLDKRIILNTFANYFTALLQNPKYYKGDFYYDKKNTPVYKIKDNSNRRRYYYFEESIMNKIKTKRYLRNRFSIELFYNDKKHPEKIIFLQNIPDFKIEMNLI